MSVLQVSQCGAGRCLPRTATAPTAAPGRATQAPPPRMLNALPMPRHSAVVAAVLLVCAVAAEAPDRPPVGSDYVYAVGEEYTVQTDASLVELAKTALRENVAAVRRRLGASACCHTPSLAPCCCRGTTHAPALPPRAASGASVGAQDEMGYTGLHWAAVNGHMEIAQLLLNAGANVEAVNDRTCSLSSTTGLRSIRHPLTAGLRCHMSHCADA